MCRDEAVLFVRDGFRGDGTRDEGLVLAMGESKGFSDPVQSLGAMMPVATVLLATETVGVSGLVGQGQDYVRIKCTRVSQRDRASERAIEMRIMDDVCPVWRGKRRTMHVLSRANGPLVAAG